MKPGLFTVEEVSAMIREGKKLLLAGDAALLSQLPKGDWIGGSTPYFILYPEQRVESFEKIFVHYLPDFVETIEIREYDTLSIENIYVDAPQNGFTVLIIPFGCPLHWSFSLYVPDYKKFARFPLCGWVAGQPMNIVMTEKSYVRSGLSDISYSNKAVAMHISLPANKYAEIHMYNSCEQGNGDIITFEHSGQIVSEAIVNGVKQSFADYLSSSTVDTEITPLVANYAGAMIAAGCVNVIEGQVYMSTPVFEKIEYRFAREKENVPEPEMSDVVVFSATCASIYMRPDVCKNLVKFVNGPAVFGEIAYQMLNGSTLYVTIGDVPVNAENEMTQNTITVK